jgi:hypothetical protein
MRTDLDIMHDLPPIFRPPISGRMAQILFRCLSSYEKATAHLDLKCKAQDGDIHSRSLRRMWHTVRDQTTNDQVLLRSMRPKSPTATRQICSQQTHQEQGTARSHWSSHTGQARWLALPSLSSPRLTKDVEHRPPSAAQCWRPTCMGERRPRSSCMQYKAKCLGSCSTAADLTTGGGSRIGPVAARFHPANPKMTETEF